MLRAAASDPLAASPTDLAVDLLATYRLMTLIKDDKITEAFRHGVFRRFGPPDGADAHKVSYLVNCPWCLGMYFAATAVAGRALNRRMWTPVARTLALSALVGLLAEARVRFLQSNDEE